MKKELQYGINVCTFMYQTTPRIPVSKNTFSFEHQRPTEVQ